MNNYLLKSYFLLSPSLDKKQITFKHLKGPKISSDHFFKYSIPLDCFNWLIHWLMSNDYFSASNVSPSAELISDEEKLLKRIASKLGKSHQF